MKAAVFLAGASALMASAKPIHKRAMETDWVTETVYVTVTAGQEQAEPTDYAVQEVASTTSSTTKKAKVHAQPSYTTVWVQAEPSTTSSSSVAEVDYTTVWVNVENVETTSSSSTSTSTTKVAVVTTTSKEAAATTSAASTSDDIDLSLTNEYSTVLTNYHNIHRANHSVDALVWDTDLASYAATVAATCVFAHDQTVGGGGYGQNIAAWGSSDAGVNMERKYGAVSVTDQWYNSEMENWSYYGQENPPDGLDIDLYGHFTQVVWKDTTKVGCATQYCASGTMYDGMDAYYTVCNYGGPGNYGGEYGDNVLEPLGKKMVVV